MDLKRPKLIVAGLIEKDGTFLLIKEVMEDKSECWIVPGGHVEFGETLEEAVLREVKEETGFDTQIIRFIAFKEAIFTANKYHTIIFFFLLKPVSGTLTLHDKALDGKFFSKGEAEKVNLVFSARWLFENHLL